MWRTFSDLDVSRDRLVQIGWTKLAVIAENCDPGAEKRRSAAEEPAGTDQQGGRLDAGAAAAASGTSKSWPGLIRLLALTPSS